MLSSAVDAVELRAHTATARHTSASRKLLKIDFTEADMEKLMCASPRSAATRAVRRSSMPALAWLESSPAALRYQLSIP